MVVFIFLSCIILKSTSFDFVLDAYGKECFSETVIDTANIEIAYEVIDGGFLDVDLTIIAPGNKVIQVIQRKANGHYMVKATQPGEYEFCFANEHSSVAEKTVVFHINFEKPPEFKKAEDQAEDHTMAIEMAMYNLASKTSEMRRGQEFMEFRDQAHSELNAASHSYVTYWSVFECLIFTFVSFCQVWYLKRFFEVRRIV